MVDFKIKGGVKNMKKLIIGIATVLVISVLVLPSCKKKEEPAPAQPPAQEQTAPQAPAEQQAPAPEQAPAQQAPSAPAEQGK